MSEDRESPLSPRTQTALENAGLTHEDAAKMAPEELVAIPGIGPAAAAQIVATAPAQEEVIETEHHDPAEALADETEHHPVEDPPGNFNGPQLVPQGTRGEDEAGLHTHIERINPDIVPMRPADVMKPTTHRVVSYAPDDHPEGVLWPYMLMRPAFTKDNVRRPAGFMVWLYPHEVSSFHRLVERERHRNLGVKGA